jgi:DNA replication and repair protein RecF
VQIEKIRVDGFRNLASTELTFSPGINLITGQNGQGKTNLLEAVVFLGSTKSFRTSRSREAISWGGGSFAVSGEISDKAGSLNLRLVVGAKGKEASVHGKRVESAQDYLGRLITVTFSPQDLELVRGGPAERRALIDRHCVDISPPLMASLINYSRALRAKAALIKQGEVRYRAIEPWNQILAREMLVITAARDRFVRELAPRAALCYEQFSSTKGERFGCSYRSSVVGYSSEEELLRALERDFSSEISSRSLRLGIHRDDLILSLNGKAARQYASQGQARSMVLALKLAILEMLEAARHESPVVLLDDVDAELDTYRADHFFRLMMDQGRQVLVTSTDAYHGVLKSDSAVTVFEVVSGIVRGSAL